MVAEGVVAIAAGMEATEESMGPHQAENMVEAMVPHLVEAMAAAGATLII